jgi:putative ATPase
MKAFGYGKGYQYAHNLENKVADMQCLPDNLRNREYFHPTNEGFERELSKRMEELSRAKNEARAREESGEKE